MSVKPVITVIQYYRALDVKTGIIIHFGIIINFVKSLQFSSLWLQKFACLAFLFVLKFENQTLNEKNAHVQAVLIISPISICTT